jgi:nitroimidazol reductase NimA-like FMN-containing flavoprotein (pyridoxamine 5'-phosphate oxidase superfamily)
MAYHKRELTDEERDTFIQENWWGVLCFGGEEPYAIPMGYQRQQGDVLVGFAATGTKARYVRQNPHVCLNICRPHELTVEYLPSFPYTSVNIEGELVPLTDTDDYDIPPVPPDFMLFKLRPKKIGTLKLDVSLE